MWFDLQAAARARGTRNGASGLLREILRAWLYQETMPVTPWSEGRMARPMYVPDPVPERIAPPRPTVDRPAAVPKAVFRADRPARPVVPWKVGARRDKAKVAA